MKQLSIVRHAHAEAVSYQYSDFARVLTKPGRDEARFVAEKASRVISKPDLILASPAARALETARIFAEVFGIDPDSVITDKTIYYTDSMEMLAMLEKLDASFQNVVVIGHNPAISELAMRLAPPPVPFFRPAAILTIELDIDNWDQLTQKRSRTFFTLIP